MSVDIATLGIKVDSTQVKSADRDLDKLTNSGKRAEGSTRGLSNAFSALGLTISAAGLLYAAKQFLDVADASKKIESQLRLATKEFGSFGQAQEDVKRIANETRSGLEATAVLYSNFVRNSEALGKSQTEAAKATETFAKTLKISGAGAAEADAATRQFGQALASGVLRGDEFNSIMENAPRLAKLLADSLNVPVGKLREMAAEGELTSEKLYAALTDTKFTESIDAEFRQVPVTFGEAMTKVYNSAIETFGAFDRGGQFSTMLANFISEGASGFGDLADEAEIFGSETRAVLAGLDNAFEPLVQAGLQAFAVLSGASNSMGIDLRRDIQTSFDDIDRFTKWLSKQGVLGSLVTPTSMGKDYREGYERQARIGRGEIVDRKIKSKFSGANIGGLSFNVSGDIMDNGPADRFEPTEKKGKKGKSEAEKAAEKAAREQAKYDAETLKLTQDIFHDTSAAIQKDLAALKKAREETNDAAKDMIASYEFENSLIGKNAIEREILIAKQEMERRGIVEGTIAYDLYADKILKAAEAKGQLEFNVEEAREYTDAMSDLNDTVQTLASSLGDMFGTVGAGLGAIISEIGNYQERQAELNEIIADGTLKESERQRAQAKYATNELNHYGNLIGAAKGFFKEKSTGYKVLQAAETAYRAFEFAMSVKSIMMGGVETAASVAQSGTKAAASTAAGAAKMFETLGPFGFAAVGAMLGLLASLAFGGKKGGGGGASYAFNPSDMNVLEKAKKQPGVSIGSMPTNDNFRTGSMSGMNQKIEINNLAPGVEIVADQVSDERISFIARRIVREDSPGAVAADMSNPNSRTAKAVKSNFEVRAKR